MKNLFFSLLILLMCSLNVSYAGNIKGQVTKGKKNISNAVIYVDLGKNESVSGKHAKMDQKNLAFIPHVLAIQAGTTVDFLNSDDLLHNVFTSDGCAENFNLGTWPKGETRSYTFKNPGCFAVMLCNVHPEMEAYVVSLGTPYFAKSSSNGSYKINNVPAGTYTLRIWHEKYQESSVTVEVPQSGDVTVNLNL